MSAESKTTMTPAEWQAASRSTGWFHSIDFGDGHWTNGHKPPAQMEWELTQWQFPADLTGKTVLDIGCADGAWSIAALRRGAKSVLSIDEQMTGGMRWMLEHKPFLLEYRKIDLFSNEFMQLPIFDVVIFTGVLYHVQDPLEALKRLRSRMREMAIMETLIDESLGVGKPMMIYYENDEIGGDPTNWWGPNTPCLEAMLRTAGFSYTRTFTTYDPGSNGTLGRIGHVLRPGHGSIYAQVSGSATGSNSMLEEARRTTAQQQRRIQELEAQLAGLG